MRLGQDRAYEALRQRLVGGQYEPGTQLREEPLASELGLSRTPVRVALKRLVADGLATSDAGQGVRVAAWTRHDIEETFQIRILLEPYAARLAAESSNESLVISLCECNKEMGEALRDFDKGSIARIQEVNHTFHWLLLEHSGAPRLRSILENMIEMPVITRSFHLATREELYQSLNHHEDLLQAVQANDGELAHDVMQLHLRMSRARFLRHRDAWGKKGL